MPFGNREIIVSAEQYARLVALMDKPPEEWDLEDQLFMALIKSRETRR